MLAPPFGVRKKKEGKKKKYMKDTHMYKIRKGGREAEWRQKRSSTWVMLGVPLAGLTDCALGIATCGVISSTGLQARVVAM